MNNISIVKPEKKYNGILAAAFISRAFDFKSGGI